MAEDQDPDASSTKDVGYVEYVWVNRSTYMLLAPQLQASCDVTQVVVIDVTQVPST